jgi:hypothetical protein
MEKINGLLVRSNSTKTLRSRCILDLDTASITCNDDDDNATPKRNFIKYYAHVTGTKTQVIYVLK